ncbi:M48 family metallopeptidase [Balneolales bacterium ANBcel1]|nr:M48 family metallopeptidase [Balneolales bacterium ANBcel1]
MKKAALQFLVALALFAGVWFALSHIDFTGGRSLETPGIEAREKIGAILFRHLEAQFPSSQNDSLLALLDETHHNLCHANGIDPASIEVHLLENPAVNAVALPGRRIVFFTGLTDMFDHPGELAGVLAHEIAHIEENHVHDRMNREVGISVMLTISGLDGAPEAIANLMRIINSSAYSRSQEREADNMAVTYLREAEIDPVHLANLLLRLSAEQRRDQARVPDWIRSHPDPRHRAETIFNQLEITPDDGQP